MNKLLLVTLCFLLMTIYCDAKKLSRSRGSGSSRSTSRSSSKSQPAPTSLSYPQQPAPKPSAVGWQEKSATPQRSQPSNSWQSKPSSGQSHSYPAQSNPTGTQGHSYPSSQSGLSGNKQPKQSPNNQESLQKSNTQTNNQQPGSHSYPASTGLSGNSGSGGSYPQGSGLSGNGVAPPPYSANNKPGTHNYGYSNHPQGPPPAYTHPQGPPPPYSNVGPNYGGYGGQGSHGPYNPSYGSQTPGYFGNYGGSGHGFGGVSRTRSALTGVGIAGAGIGTILTGLALWNLARSTGRHQHTVIYDNRGQPVAVAPSNGTELVNDPILGDLVNCTLTISTANTTEVLAIPCAIATSFTPDADIKDSSMNNNATDKTECTVTVITKAGREFMTTIPCSTLLNTAAENNVTEPVLDEKMDVQNLNGTVNLNNQNPNFTNQSLSNGTVNISDCQIIPIENQDPINPCFPVTHNLTVVPLTIYEHNDKLNDTTLIPNAA